MQDNIIIPYNEAGQQAFDVFFRVAAKLYADAQTAVNEYIAQSIQTCKTVSERHEDGQYRRTVQTADGRTQTVSYDYQTKAIQTT